jgi:hypothetical protein
VVSIRHVCLEEQQQLCKLNASIAATTPAAAAAAARQHLHSNTIKPRGPVAVTVGTHGLQHKVISAPRHISCYYSAVVYTYN